VFRAQQMEGGRPAEFGQMGIEIIGDKTVFADAEVIVTAVQLMKELGIESFKLTIGHAGVLHDILDDYTDHDYQREILRNLLVERNYVGFEEAVHEFDLPATKANALLEFINEATNLPSIEDMEKYVRKNDGIEYMKQLSKLIDAYDLSQYVSFDFTLSSHMSYYTGMLFEIFASGSGFPLGNGGRYDGLLHLFGSDVGATGFSIRIDRLLEVLPKEEVEEETVCILFDDEDFIKALDLASTLREQGARVTVQSKKGLMNKEAFTKLFSRVVDLSQEEAQ